MSELIDLTGDGGVKKRVLEEGVGDTPPDAASVSVHYEGYLEDGRMFDSSREQNAPFRFKLGVGMVIKGWDIALATMKVGEKAEIICSPQYAYGENGSPPDIPPNATLRFVIELINFEKDPDSISERLAAAGRDKQRGNDLFKAGKYSEAIDAYTAAIDRFRFVYPRDADKTAVENLKLMCYLNQAACQLKLHNYNAARLSCEHALDIDEKNVKAFFRRAQSWAGVGDFDKAIEDIKHAITLDPSNVELRKELANIKQQQQAYLQKQRDVFAKMGAGLSE